jgi:adenylate kinase family enzyme
MRYAILGNAGAGKSTLAQSLGAKLHITPIDLDKIFWEPDQPGIARQTIKAQSLLRAELNGKPSWIIEGCYEELIQSIFDLKPILVWLDPGVNVCQKHCRERPWETHKYSSKAAQDKNLPMLLNWVSDHYERTGSMSYEAHKELYDSYRGRKEHIHEYAVVSDL